MLRRIAEIKDILISQYDYIEKIDAMYFIKNVTGNKYTLKEIVTAYNEINY